MRIVSELFRAFSHSMGFTSNLRTVPFSNPLKSVDRIRSHSIRIGPFLAGHEGWKLGEFLLATKTSLGPFPPDLTLGVLDWTDVCAGKTLCLPVVNAS